MTIVKKKRNNPDIIKEIPSRGAEIVVLERVSLESMEKEIQEFNYQYEVLLNEINRRKEMRIKYIHLEQREKQSHAKLMDLNQLLSSAKASYQNTNKFLGQDSINDSTEFFGQWIEFLNIASKSLKQS